LGYRAFFLRTLLPLSIEVSNFVTIIIDPSPVSLGVPCAIEQGSMNTESSRTDKRIHSMLQTRLVYIYKAAYSATMPAAILPPASPSLRFPLHAIPSTLDPTIHPFQAKHNLSSHPPTNNPNLESHLLLNLRNRQPGIQSLRTSPRTIQNSMAPIQTHTIIQRRLPLLLLLIPAIRQPPITLQQYRRSQILL